MKCKILIDTNVILRLLIGDIPYQQKKSQDLFKKIEDGKSFGLISILVINEFVKISTKFYKKSLKETIDYVLNILSIKNIAALEIDKKELIQILNNALNWGIDFTDAYLLFFGNKNSLQVSSFDKKLVKLMNPN